MKRKSRGVFYSNPKFGKSRVYQGTYSYNDQGERMVALEWKHDNQTHTVIYENHQAVTKAGWKKVAGK